MLEWKSQTSAYFPAVAGAVNMAVPPRPATLTSKPPVLDVTVWASLSALVIMIIVPGATEAGTVNMKSLMVTTAVADEPPDVDDVADGVAGPGAADVAAEDGASDDVGELDVGELDVGGALVAVDDDVGAVATGAGAELLQALSASASPPKAIVARRMG